MLMIPEIVWNEIKKVIPGKKSKVGRPRKDAQRILSGIFYVMRTGCQWSMLPDFYGKKSTVHGYFMKWARTGVFERIFSFSTCLAIEFLGNTSCFIIDTSSSKSPFARFAGKSPIDRGKHGVKRSIVIDWNKIIFSILVDGADTHDSKLLVSHLPTLKSYISLEKPSIVLADSAWDVKALRSTLAAENIVLYASTNVRRDKNKKKSKPGGRWRIEQIFGMQHWNRGLKTCWSKSKDTFLAFCQFTSSIHNFKLAGVFG